MRYTPRRRRGDEEQHEGGGLPVVPLVIIVVFAGLLLGGLLAHFFGGGGSSAQQAMSPSLVSPVPSPTLIASPTPFVRPHHTPAPTPATTPSATPSQTPSPKPTPKPTPVPTATPQVETATPAPAATEAATAAPEQTAEPTQSPRPVLRNRGMQTSDPTSVVRAYLDALSRGNDAQASSYLESGGPAEPFMRNASVEDIESSDNGDGTYLVSADVHARTGKYRVTFTVAALPDGMVITDHFYVKPH